MNRLKPYSLTATALLTCQLGIASSHHVEAGEQQTGKADVKEDAAGQRTSSSIRIMHVDTAKEDNSRTIKDEARIWPGEVYSFWGLSKLFDPLNSQGSLGSPAATLFSYAVNKGSPGDVTALIGDAVVVESGKTVFGANFIARSDAGVVNAKLVGAEIDVEPAKSSSVAAGAGLYLNAFNVAMPIPAVQIGGLSGGTFQNGFICNAVIDSCNSAQRGLAAKSFIDTSNGNYTDGAIILGNRQRILFVGADRSDSEITTTSNGDLTLKASTGSIVAMSPVQVPSFPFRSLPPTGSPARLVFCSDCLKPGEKNGAGTGMMLFDDGHNRWTSIIGTPAAH
jgi:hypothetical protein